jgi:hypothetical protein
LDRERGYGIGPSGAGGQEFQGDDVDEAQRESRGSEKWAWASIR